MTEGTKKGPAALLRRVLRGMTIAAASVSVGLILLGLAGFFHRKIQPAVSLETQATQAPAEVAEVQWIERPRQESAVGTVRPVHETTVAAKILARVVEIRVKAGQPVQAGEVLVRLDDADLQARVKQAEAALATAQSHWQRARSDYQRALQLLQSKALAQAEFDRVENDYRAARAEWERATQALQEAKVFLGYATITAPMSGIVVDKRVEAGDTVVPGQALLTLYDPSRMQLLVTVRESLAERLQVGQKVRGRIEALRLECEGTISEIVPELQAASRSFIVKVTGPCPPGVHSGMFGRIFIPLDHEKILVVPAAAVRKVGQLDLVEVIATDGQRQRRHVQLGRQLDGLYEVLAGLRPGERVVVPRQRKA